MELHLDTVRCFNYKSKRCGKRAGLRRLFLVFFLGTILALTDFSQAIPWSLESEYVYYFNSPLDWTVGFSNMKNLNRFLFNQNIDSKNESTIEQISLTYSCEQFLVERLLQSKIIVIQQKADNSDKDIFSHYEDYLFNCEEIFHTVEEGLTKGIVIVENFQGLQEFLEIISEFRAQFFRQGDYLIATTQKDLFSNFIEKMVNRNEFSEDILLYVETPMKNLTITNAFSFLNIETKTLNPSVSEPRDPLTMFFVQQIELPFEHSIPDRLIIFSNERLRDFFYQQFEVVSSVEEWQLFLHLIESVCSYGYFYESEDGWLIGFKANEDYVQIEDFRNQMAKWGMSEEQITIKPYTNEYYLTIQGQYFCISNFSPNLSTNNPEESGLNKMLNELIEKIGKREAYEAGYEYNEKIGFNCYFFSSFDDKIKKEIIRIF